MSPRTLSLAFSLLPTARLCARPHRRQPGSGRAPPAPSVAKAPRGRLILALPDTTVGGISGVDAGPGPPCGPPTGPPSGPLHSATRWRAYYEQVTLNPERWYRDIITGPEYILINLPAFVPQVVRGNCVQQQRRATAGQPATPIPTFSSVTTCFTPASDLERAALRCH